MPTSPLYELYKLRLPVALALCLPALLGAAYYGWSAWAGLDRYRRLADDAPPIDLELFHLALHDELDRDLRRFLLDDPPTDGGLPLFELSLSRSAYDRLLAQVGEGEPEYVPALIRHDGTMHEAKVRLRGRQPWHALGVQKSLKVRLDKGDLIAGMRVFNLVNDPTPFGLEEQLLLDLARDQGLLSPEYQPAWVRLNNTDLGVMRFEAQPAEGLLRRQRRMPGNIYSGDLEATGPQTGLGALFSDPSAWQKAASRVPEEAESLADIERLLATLRQASHAELRDFAEVELDLERFARFSALDALFGGKQHDYVSNHKLAFDVYRGRFEPIGWSFRAFTHDPEIDLVENPLLLRLKALPEFLPLRNRALYRLLLGDGAPAAVRARADQLFAELDPFLAADPYWDAYKLLPRASRFVRFMPRPMNRRRALLVAEAELKRFAARHRFLLAALEAEELHGRLHRVDPVTWAVEVTVDGAGAYTLQRVLLPGVSADATLFADRDLDGRLTAADPVVARGPAGEALRPGGYDALLAGVRLEPRPEGPDKHGPVRSRPSPRLYRYLVRAPGARLTSVSLELESRVTGLTARRELALTSGSPSDLPAAPAADLVPTLGPGELSPHPWAFVPRPPPVEVRLGPGVVTLGASRVFGAGETVIVAPGTTFALHPDVSLIFHGRVHAVGTPSAPIVFAPAVDGHSFGGLVLLGPNTAGSRFEEVVIRGGSHPTYRAVYTPSLVNLYDTHDVTFASVAIHGARDCEDLVHATYVERLRLFDLTLEDAPVDAVDLEYTNAELRGLRVRAAGDECLDLMASRVTLVASGLSACAKNAVSAGEESEVTVHDVAIVAAETGVLAKNAAQVRISRSLIAGTEVALRTNRREVHYDAPSRIDAEGVFLLGNDKLKRDAARTRVELRDFAEDLPADELLRQKFAELLDLEDLDALEPDGGEEP